MKKSILHVRERVRGVGEGVGCGCGNVLFQSFGLLFLLSFHRRTLIPSSLQLWRREAALERSEAAGPDRMSADRVCGSRWHAVEVKRAANMSARLVEATDLPVVP